MIEFRTHPDTYKHWRLSVDGAVATLALDVDENGGIAPGYDLKLNSYDLGVDIELYDAMQRLRFEHPTVQAVVITSHKDRVFSAGANIRMLGQASHEHKVNFCKFTNETRNAIEDATAYSGQTYLCAINGTAAGGGYELALATDYIILIDDGAASVSLPEVPLLAVLPGTGGLTRLVDKRKVRRDHADFFCTTEEGVRGQRAKDWRLVDEVVPSSRFHAVVAERARQAAKRSDRPPRAGGLTLTPLARHIEGDQLRYSALTADIDRVGRVANVTIHGPTDDAPKSAAEILERGVRFWPLALARELDDFILYMRLNEPDVGTWVFKTIGNLDRVLDYDRVLALQASDWLVREITLYWKRTLKRLDVTSRSLVALIEPGSCFAGTLLELALAADRSYMLDGQFENDDRPAPTVALSAMNFGALPMVNDATRLAMRYLDEPGGAALARAALGKALDADAACRWRLVTFTPDDIDWDDEVRLALEERTSFSPDALTGMEASLRFAGPETLESKIFGRLSAWQNWIFQRPNAVGDKGALTRYGSGRRGEFDKHRV
ncbi:MAG: 2,3-epoxybenzoyl-CoA dihydrolase [Gammaproteobacteria bacterium]|nr:2,3-epoxybenzoyl-CoA dihydrolase [Gammaproteobacteria bacterium]